MTCKFCGTEHDLHSCPNCGAVAPKASKQEPIPQPIPVHVPTQPAKKRSSAKGCTIAICIVILFLVIGIFVGVVEQNGQSTQAITSSTAPAKLPLFAPGAGTEAFQSLPETEYKDAALSPNLSDMVRYPNNYKKQDFVLEIKLEQAVEIEGLDGFIAFVRAPDGSWPSWNKGQNIAKENRVILIDARSEGSARLFDNDIVTIWGDFAGTYESTKNGKQELAVFYCRYAELNTDPTAKYALGTDAFYSLSEEEYKANATPMNLDEVNRYPDRSTGVDYRITIEVTQDLTFDGLAGFVGVLQNEDGSFPTASDDNWSTRRCGFINTTATTSAVANGEKLTVYGEFSHTTTFESFVATVKAPVFNVRYIEPVELPVSNPKPEE